MADKTVIWYLCAACARDLASALSLEQLKKKPREDKLPCQSCGRKCFGAAYKIRYKTKGE